MMNKLPAPACVFGYTTEQVEQITHDLPAFHKWMHGQTIAVCPEHGPVYYTYDVRAFVGGGPIYDW